MPLRLLVLLTKATLPEVALKLIPPDRSGADNEIEPPFPWAS